VGAMKRTALPGNFLSNYSQGGLVESYKIEEDRGAGTIALNTSELFKLDYGGIDLMKNEKGNWVVLEVIEPVNLKVLSNQQELTSHRK